MMCLYLLAVPVGLYLLLVAAWLFLWATHPVIRLLARRAVRKRRRFYYRAGGRWRWMDASSVECRLQAGHDDFRDELTNCLIDYRLARTPAFLARADRLVGLSREAFELPAVDARTGRGVPDLEAFGVLVAYYRFTGVAGPLPVPPG